jgi:hypothetical protein
MTSSLPIRSPSTGSARVRVSHAGITTGAHGVSEEGVRARIAQRSGFVVVHLSARKHCFKYLEHTVLHSPERLVIDLWKARPPRPAAEFPVAPQGGCLSIDNFADPPGRVTANGTENDLFEHMFQANVRNRKGRVVGRVP